MTAGPSGDHMPAQGAEPIEPIALMESVEHVEPAEPVESVLVEGSGRRCATTSASASSSPGLAVAALLVGGLIALVLAMAG